MEGEGEDSIQIRPRETEREDRGRTARRSKSRRVGKSCDAVKLQFKTIENR